MKKQFTLICTFCVLALRAQIGINTSNPQNTFHIDGNKDNNAAGTPTAVQQSNDVIITSAGNIGVGTTQPATRLDINNGTTNGAIKIVDGTQGNGKVLTSDTNGVGTWKESTVTIVSGTTPTSRVMYGTTADKYMDSYIDVPTGRWIVSLGFLVNGAIAANTRYGSRLTLSSSATSLQQNGFSFISGNSLVLTQISNGSAGANLYGMFSAGVIRVNVTSTAPLRLYVWDTDSRSYGNVAVQSLNDNGENYIYATKIN